MPLGKQQLRARGLATEVRAGVAFFRRLVAQLSMPTRQLQR